MSESNKKEFGIDDVEKKIFSVESLVNGLEYYDKIVGLESEVTVYSNFEAENFPEGFELAFVPIKQRQDGADKGNKLVSVAVVAVPTLETVLGLEEKGEVYVRNSLQNDFVTKAANSVGPRSDGSIAGSMPKTVGDFITTASRGEGTKTYKEIAPAFVKFFKQKGLRLITSAMLRQCLQSTAFAKSTFGKIEQETWEKVLNAMVSVAVKKGLDPSILNHWLEHRDEAEEMEMDFDFSGLSEAFGEASTDINTSESGVEADIGTNPNMPGQLTQPGQPVEANMPT